MKSLTGTLATDKEELKKLLPAEDILTFDFVSAGGVSFCCIYADPITDKDLLSEQVIQPMRAYTGKTTCEAVALAVPSPEMKKKKNFSDIVTEILIGNPALIWEGADEAVIVGPKKCFRAPSRSRRPTLPSKVRAKDLSRTLRSTRRSCAADSKPKNCISKCSKSGDYPKQRWRSATSKVLRWKKS